jgi:bidirectional [NiFe] hydrogenase diaphorase subunit
LYKEETSVISLVIDGKRVEGEKNETVLQVARRNGIEIPALCFHEGLEAPGTCRLCMVEITKPDWGDWKKTVASCVFPIEEGISVETENQALVSYRKEIVELLLARVPNSKWLKEYARSLGVLTTKYQPDKDNDNCILCSLCTRTCEQLGCNAISIAQRGRVKEVLPPLREPPEDCMGCLSCAMICPTSNIPFEKSSQKIKIWNKEFETLKCEKCGAGIIAVDYAKYLEEKRNIPLKNQSICEACKRAETRTKFKEILLWDKTPKPTELEVNQ